MLYPLPEILLLLLCATLAGADDVAEIGAWGEENLAFLIPRWNSHSMPSIYG